MPAPRKPDDSGAQNAPAEAPAQPQTPDEDDVAIATSSDARHSTYKEVEPADFVPDFPPPGRLVEQERGKPSESSE